MYVMLLVVAYTTTNVAEGGFRPKSLGLYRPTIRVINATFFYVFLVFFLENRKNVTFYVFLLCFTRFLELW